MNTMRRHRRIGTPQKGVVALAIALLIVVVTTVVTVGVSQIGVGEQKNMANEMRNQEASAAADAGIARGIMYLSKNASQIRQSAGSGWMNVASTPHWTACTNGSTALPCGDGTANQFDSNWTAYSNVPNLFSVSDPLNGRVTVYFVARNGTAGSSLPGRTVFYILARGTSIDGSGTVLAKQAYSFAPFLARTPDAPLIAAGTIATTGALNVVANPNGGGSGVPLSSWSNGNTNLAGSMQTCHIEEFLSTDSTYSYQSDADGNTVTLCPACACPNNASLQLSSSGVEGIDILDVDSNAGVNPDSTSFPADVFQYVFGIPESDYQKVKDKAKLISDCSTLGPTSSGLYWHPTGTGNCQMPANINIGSVAAPVLLVVEDTEFRMNNNGAFFGLIFAFSRTATATVSIQGGPTLYGSLISNQNINLGNGNYNARYDAIVLENLAKSLDNGGMYAVPGSWTDY